MPQTFHHGSSSKQPVSGRERYPTTLVLSRRICENLIEGGARKLTTATNQHTATASTTPTTTTRRDDMSKATSRTNFRFSTMFSLHVASDVAGHRRRKVGGNHRCGQLSNPIAQRLPFPSTLTSASIPFLPRDTLLSAVYAVVVCLSVCLCVCHTPVLYQNG